VLIFTIKKPSKTWIRKSGKEKNKVKEVNKQIMKGGLPVAKKYNKGKRQKRNLDKYRLKKFREEIAREMGISVKNLAGEEGKKQKPQKESNYN